MTAKRISLIIGIMLGVASLIGVGIKVDAHYAKQKYVEMIEQRLEQKIWSDRYYRIQERIWTLEDRYPDPTKMPPAVKEELRRLKLLKKQIEEKLRIPIEQIGSIVVAVAHAKATAGMPISPKNIKINKHG